MTPLTPKLRSALTLGLLAVLLLIGLSVGWATVTEPFPSSEETAPEVCSESSVAIGERVKRPQVTVSVLNSSGRLGLAGQTADSLSSRGFGLGSTINAPDDTEVQVAQIWTNEPRNPAVRLVISHLQNKPKIVRRDPVAPGVNLVVGDDFPGVVDGRRGVKVKQEATICVPNPELQVEDDPALG